MLNYETKFGDSHTFSAMVGFEAIKNSSKSLFASDKGFPVEQPELIFIGNGSGKFVH